jgi:hypothetical protein
MATLGNLKRRLAVLERIRQNVAPLRRVVVIKGSWRELVCGFDPDAVQAALLAHPGAVLIVPGTLAPDQWNLASRCHHQNLFSTRS